jgi:hypothetical protein
MSLIVKENFSQFIKLFQVDEDNLLIFLLLSNPKISIHKCEYKINIWTVK